MRSERQLAGKRDHLRTLPYGILLRKDQDGDWVARVAELPGCTAHGTTQAEALKNLDEVMEVWLEDALISGAAIPEPRGEERLPSGKWLQRVPRSLHKKLIELAEHEQASLNQMVTSILAEAVGRRRGSAQLPQTGIPRRSNIVIHRPKRAASVD